MLRNPYFQLICAIFRVINALRNRNDSFDCHALTSQSKVSSHMYIWVGMYACTGNRKYDPYTPVHMHRSSSNTEHIIKYSTVRALRASINGQTGLLVAREEFRA